MLMDGRSSQGRLRWTSEMWCTTLPLGHPILFSTSDTTSPSFLLESSSRGEGPPHLPLPTEPKRLTSYGSHQGRATREDNTQRRRDTPLPRGGDTPRVVPNPRPQRWSRVSSVQFPPLASVGPSTHCSPLVFKTGEGSSHPPAPQTWNRGAFSPGFFGAEG